MSGEARDLDRDQHSGDLQRLIVLHGRYTRRLWVWGVSVLAIGLLAPAATSAEETLFLACVFATGVVAAMSMHVYGWAALMKARRGWRFHAIMGTPLAIAAVAGLVAHWALGCAVCLAFPLFSLLATHGVFRGVPRGHAALAGGVASVPLCLTCGYEVRGLPTDVCPECGKESGIGATP